jgi:hypothetical protein
MCFIYYIKKYIISRSIMTWCLYNNCISVANRLVTFYLAGCILLFHLFNTIKEQPHLPPNENNITSSPYDSYIYMLFFQSLFLGLMINGQINCSFYCELQTISHFMRWNSCYQKKKKYIYIYIYNNIVFG